MMSGVLDDIPKTRPWGLWLVKFKLGGNRLARCTALVLGSALVKFGAKPDVVMWC